MNKEIIKENRQEGENEKTTLNYDIKAPVMQTNWQRRLFKGFAWGSVIIEPFYSWFLWESVYKAIIDTIKEILGTQTLSPELVNFIKIAAVPFAVANLMGDITSVDPAAEADAAVKLMKQEEELATAIKAKIEKLKKIISGNAFDQKEEDLKNKLKQLEKEIVLLENLNEQKDKKAPASNRILKQALIYVASIFSYPFGAAADILPLQDTFNKIPNVPARYITKTVPLLFVTILGITYYGMFTNTKIERHVNRFVETVKSPLDLLRFIKNNPLVSMEIMLQAASNAMYRGVSFAYLISALLAYFELSNTNDIAKAATVAELVITFIITAFSRTTPTIDQFANPNFNYITEEERNQAKVMGFGLVPTAVLPIIRGACLGVLVDIFTRNYSPMVNYGLSITAGISIALASGKVRYDKYINENILKLLSKEELENRKAKLESEEDSEQEKEIEDSNAVEKTKYLVADEEFGKIVKALPEPPAVNMGITMINIMARIARLVGFILFVLTLDQLIFNGALGIKGSIALGLMWAAGVFESDGATFQESMVERINNIRAHALIQKANAEIESTATEKQPLLVSNETDMSSRSSRTWADFFQEKKESVVRYSKAFIQSPYDHSIEQLQLASEKAQKKAKAQKVVGDIEENASAESLSDQSSSSRSFSS